MSDYMLAPGARLEVGPGGRLEESLGACCSGCASGQGGCGNSDLGSTRGGGGTHPTMLNGWTITAWGHDVTVPAVAVGAIGVWWLFFRKKKRRRR